MSSITKKESQGLYKKQHSFSDFYSNIASDIDQQKVRVLEVLQKKISAELKSSEIIQSVIRDLLSPGSEVVDFRITQYISDEISKLEEHQIPQYMIHRYRYDVYPNQKKLDRYPPYLQIEPTSICNFRCVFCYQSDKNFFSKSSSSMGMMSLPLFKDIIDQSLGNIEFFSLASRGEPLVCLDIDKMLEYCRGKFLGLKVNTNASLLNEKHCHAILAGGVNTIVFSADAAEEPLYSQLRVGGKLETVLRNIELFNSIRDKHYPKSKIITRVSGVKVQQGQEMHVMLKTWGRLVDQITFVVYNPWENVYESPINDITTPCSDLWRRMFVWYDGQVNPCDTDYKSTLLVGQTNSKTISELWRSENYMKLRELHLNKQRQELNPCRRCVVV